MGTIKDLVDLVTQLSNNVKDRKTASELREIQTLALKIQSEQVSLHEANMELREERQALRDKIRSLECKIEELSTVAVIGPSGIPQLPQLRNRQQTILYETCPPRFHRYFECNI